MTIPVPLDNYSSPPGWGICASPCLYLERSSILEKRRRLAAEASELGGGLLLGRELRSGGSGGSAWRRTRAGVTHGSLALDFQDHLKMVDLVFVV